MHFFSRNSDLLAIAALAGIFGISQLERPEWLAAPWNSQRPVPVFAEFDVERNFERSAQKFHRAIMKMEREVNSSRCIRITR